jgi:hypothetical protein
VPFPLASPARFNVPYKSLIELRAAYMPDAAWAVSGHPPSRSRKKGQPPVLTSSTQKLNSGRWGETDVVSKVLDAISELGSDADLIAFDKKIGAEVLVERAILQHVVDGSQQ